MDDICIQGMTRVLLIRDEWGRVRQDFSQPDPPASRSEERRAV